MAFNFKNIFKGLRLRPKSGATAVDSMGDLDVTSSNGKLNYHNGTTGSPILTEAHTATVTNKSIDSDNNTITNIKNADIKAGADIARNKLASGTASHVIINDGSGVMSSEAALAISRGGTGSGTALNNNRVMQSSGGTIVEAAAITGNRALISDANGIPTHSAVTNTELGYLSGLSSAVQTQIDNHLNDATDAHDASAISFSPVGSIAATDAQTAIAEVATDAASALSTHESDTSTHGVGTVAGLTETQVFTNKDYDGGTASNSNRITVPKNTKTNLDGLARKEATVVYATDESQLYVDTGSELVPVGSGAEFVATAGENLTAGEIVYISVGNPTDAGRTAGRIYKVDRSDDYRMEFVGFVVATATSGNPVRIKSSGIIDGLVGLTAGTLYYADSTAGAITATAPTTTGVWSVPIGTAISTTELIINTNGNADAAYVEDGSSYFDMSNNQTSQNVTGLAFSTSLDRGVIINYSINRVNTSPNSEYVQVGRLTLGYRGTAGTWFIQDDYAGDTAGVTFAVDASGQVQYTSTNVSGTQSQFRMRWSYVRLDQ